MNGTISTAAREAAGREDTAWGQVFLLVGAGIVAAMQVGKVPPALTTLQSELGVSLVVGGWIISMFSAIGALIGCLAGTLTARIGARRAAVGGLLGMAAASALGGFAPNAAWLLLSRAVEGAAFVITVVAIPGLLNARTGMRDRRFVPSIWGTYMPAGVAIALALTPFVIAASSWRVVWEGSALLLLVAAVLLWRGVDRPHAAAAPARLAGLFEDTLRQPAILLLGAIFACYTFQHIGVTGFLPTILQQLGFGAQAAGLLTAFALATGVAGNLFASWLIARHVAPRRVMQAGFVLMLGAGAALFVLGLPPLASYGFAVLYTGFAGLVPSAIFATLPQVVDPRVAAPAMGVIVQSSHLGQLAGPPTLAAAVAAWGGWEIAPLLLAPSALLGILFASRIRAGH